MNAATISTAAGASPKVRRINAISPAACPHASQVSTRGLSRSIKRAMNGAPSAAPSERAPATAPATANERPSWRRKSTAAIPSMPIDMRATIIDAYRRAIRGVRSSAPYEVTPQPYDGPVVGFDETLAELLGLMGKDVSVHVRSPGSRAAPAL